jgi:hypothetical protein
MGNDDDTLMGGPLSTGDEVEEIDEEDEEDEEVVDSPIE